MAKIVYKQLQFPGMEIYNTQLTDDVTLFGSLAVYGFRHGVRKGEVFDDFAIVFHSYNTSPSEEVDITELEETFGLPSFERIGSYTDDEIIDRIAKASLLISKQ